MPGGTRGRVFSVGDGHSCADTCVWPVGGGGCGHAAMGEPWGGCEVVRLHLRWVHGRRMPFGSGGVRAFSYLLRGLQGRMYAVHLPWCSRGQLRRCSDAAMLRTLLCGSC